MITTKTKMITTKRKGSALLLVALSAIAWLPMNAVAVPVDLELAVAVDGSGSVSDDQFNSQILGVADAFNSFNAFRSGFSVAPSLVTFSSAFVAPDQSVGFTLVDDGASAAGFADAVSAVSPPSFSGNRDIDDAINFAAPLFDDNGFEGDRLALILLSGGIDDGNPNAVANARDSALGGIDAIDGVAFQAAGAAGSPSADVLAFLQNTVIGGPDGFGLDAGGSGSLSDAVSTAVTAEIQGAGNAADVPAPPMLMLFALALSGIVLVRTRPLHRRRESAARA